MQNKYVGDIGDFGKYGLLRALCGLTGSEASDQLSLGIVWYFVRDRGIGYFDDPDGFRDSDPEVFDALVRIVNDSQRSVASVARSRVFPAGTVFFPEAVPPQLGDRQEWLQHALESTKDCELVFLDPDNGLEIPSTQRHHKRGPKYVYYDEIARFLDRGQSVIVIHHAGRTKNQTVKKQAQTLLDKIRTKIRGTGSAFALRYHRGAPARVFFVIPAKRDQDILLSRAEQLTQDAWSGHFSLVDPESI
jgi:hypothetical protein